MTRVGVPGPKLSAVDREEPVMGQWRSLEPTASFVAVRAWRLWEDYGVGVGLPDTSNFDRVPDDVERRAA
jgi:hypothetical protein